MIGGLPVDEDVDRIAAAIKLPIGGFQLVASPFGATMRLNSRMVGHPEVINAIDLEE